MKYQSLPALSASSFSYLKSPTQAASLEGTLRTMNGKSTRRTQPGVMPTVSASTEVRGELTLPAVGLGGSGQRTGTSLSPGQKKTTGKSSFLAKPSVL